MPGCDDGRGLVQFDLTIASTNGGSVITRSEGTCTYEGGEVVKLVATPDAGYRFVNWSGNTEHPKKRRGE